MPNNNELGVISKRSTKRAITKPAKPKADDSQKLLMEKIQASMLDAADAKLLLMKPANKAELVSLGLPGKKAFELPYFDATGRPTGFKRWRYLEDTRDGIAAHTDAKPVRYVQSKDTIQEVYMPPLVDWSAVQKDIALPIVITEGELKAACCTKLAYPCLGLGGVFSFKSTKRKLPLLPIFYDFVWKGRTVIVAYDSDAHTNRMVVMARNELCRELLALGALPHVADITAADDNSKRGMDDMAYQDGAEELRTVLSMAEPFAPSAALHQLNAEVSYIKNPGMIVVIDTGLKMRPSDFTSHAYSNRHYWEQTLDAQGNERLVKKKAATAWLEWPLRMELERIAYEPGQPKITAAAEYNMWHGWGCDPKKGSVKPWQELLDHLFRGHPVERAWFERWCALPLQQPGAKMYTAVALWGISTGTGKSLVGYTLGRIYGDNFTEISDIELQDDRNEWAINKQFVMGDDVTGHEQRKHADRLKKMITQLSMRIDQKYVPSYTVKDHINYYFTANHPDMFFLEDDDRRNFVHEVKVGPLPRDWYKQYMKWLNDGGAEALFHYLLGLDLKGMAAEDRAPDTQARRAMIEDGLSDMGRWVRRLRDDPDHALRVGNINLQGDLWGAAELLRIYDPESRSRATTGGIGKELKRAGFKQAYEGMPVKTSSGQQRLFIVRNTDQWQGAQLKDIIAHYNTTRAGIKRGQKY